MAGSHSRNASESRRPMMEGDEDDSVLGTALTVRPLFDPAKAQPPQVSDILHC